MTDGGAAAARPPEPPRRPEGMAEAAPAPSAPVAPIEVGTRDDVGRVIGRALEHEPANETVATDDEVLSAVARELDVAPEHLALAVVEERASDDTGLVARIVGPATVSAQRVVLVDDALVDRVEQWLERGHGLRVVAVDGEQIRAIRRTDKLGKITASVKAAGGSGRLGRFRTTTVHTATVDDRTALGVEVELIEQRGRAVLGGTVAGTAGLGVVALGAVIVSPLVAVAAPAAVVGGAAVARKSYRKHREIAEVEAEEMADGLARNHRPPRLRDEVESRIRGRSRRSLREPRPDDSA